MFIRADLATVPWDYAFRNAKPTPKLAGDPSQSRVTAWSRQIIPRHFSQQNPSGRGAFEIATEELSGMWGWGGVRADCVSLIAFLNTIASTKLHLL